MAGATGGVGAPGGPIVRLEGVGLHYRTANGDLLEAVRKADLEIAAGEFVSLIGPSGCGKTTILKLISNLLAPTQGRILVQGEPPSEAKRRRQFGFVFQDSVLLPWRTVMENATLLLEIVGIERDRMASKVTELLGLVGLRGFEGRYPHELSGGMRQRVSMVRALSLDPAILLMDEPFGALDEMTRDRMNMELLRIWEATGTTIVFVTHSIPEAVFLSQRVVVMSARPGQIKEIVPIDLPRPRQVQVKDSVPFIGYTRRIRDLINGMGE